jgi:WD40 repeat protein
MMRSCDGSTQSSRSVYWLTTFGLMGLSLLLSKPAVGKQPKRGGQETKKASISPTLVYSSPASEVVRTGRDVQPADSPCSLAFSPDGKILVSGGWWGTIKLRDGFTGKELAVLKGHSWVVSTLAFSSDGKWLFSGSRDGTAKVWDLAARKEQSTRIFLPSNISSLAIAADGKTLAESSSEHIGGAQIWREGKIRLWDTAGGRRKATLVAHKKRVECLAFSPDGKLLASGSDDTTVKLWDVEKGKLWKDLGEHDDQVMSVAFAPDGRTLAVGMHGGNVRLWETASAKPRLTLRRFSLFAFALAWSPDGRTLAVAGEEYVRLWDATSGTLIGAVSGHDNCIHSVAFSSDGNRLASGSVNNILKLWKMKN